MDAVLNWEDRPNLRSPQMVCAFEGWNDAGEAASIALRWMITRTDARTIATINPEEFYDFTVHRPEVELADGGVRRLTWPVPRLLAARLEGHDRDLVFCQGIEPSLKWSAFTNSIVVAAQTLGVESVIGLGAFLADVAHTAPVAITGTLTDARLASELGISRSNYEGPTGIVGVLHDAFRSVAIPSISLWAGVPHYVSQTPSPKAALALIARLQMLTETALDTSDLMLAAADYEAHITELVAQDDEASEYVRQLESEIERITEAEISGLPEITSEIEEFLRDQPE